jgi:hypothetical protein
MAHGTQDPDRVGIRRDEKNPGRMSSGCQAERVQAQKGLMRRGCEVMN